MLEWAAAVPDAPGTAARHATAEIWATRVASQVPSVLKRVPFTVTVVVATLVVGVVTGTIWVPIRRMSWFPEVACGLPALREGRWWTYLTCEFFALTPGQYIIATVVFAALVGTCEIHLGSRLTATACVLGQLVGLFGATGVIAALSMTSWPWAQEVATTRDVGFTTGMLTVVALASARLRSPWRFRVRAVLWLYITVAFLFLGTFSDVAHLVAVGLGLLIGQRMFGLEPGFGPRTRRETRLLAFAGLLVIGLVELVTLFFPGRSPLGTTTAYAGPVIDVAIDIVLIAFLANRLRRGQLWAWWVTVVFGLVNLALAVVALVLILAGELPDGAPITLGSGLLWIAELLLLLFNRRAFRVPLRRRVPGGLAAGEDTTARARRLLHDNGGSTMSWMTLWPENRYRFTEDGQGYVAYQRHAGVAVALTDPVTEERSVGAAILEFAAEAERGGLIPCLFSIGPAAADIAAASGWRTVKMAEDTIVELTGLEFKGKSWQDVRSALNKAKRESLTFRLVTLAEEPFSILAQVRAISEQWVGKKDLPEMGFTLGGVEEALDPEVRVGLAIDADGSVHGVTSWLPVYGPGTVVRGWTLDVMRRRPDGFRPVVEYLIASSCLSFKASGAQFVSLSGAPLATSAEDDPAAIDRVLSLLGGALEPLYGFRSLHQFKAKFIPRYEPVYLAYRDEADLARIGMALTRAYLPDVSTRQLVRVSVSARRSGRPTR